MQDTMRWGKIVLICALALTVFFVVRGQLTSAQQSMSEQETALRIQQADLNEEQVSLEAQIAQVGTDSYVETRAREDYQFIKPGELRFEFENPEELYAYSDEEAQIREEAMAE
jgi:cell division protein FtsB